MSILGRPGGPDLHTGAGGARGRAVSAQPPACAGSGASVAAVIVIVIYAVESGVCLA